MKKFSKILVLLLTFSLLLGALAVFASADVSETDVAKIGDTGYATLELAWADAMAAEEPVTITLLANTTTASALSVDQSVTVDLNWFTLSATGSVFAMSTNDVTLTVKNGSVTHVGNFLDMKGDKITFNGSNLHVLNKQSAKNKLFINFAQASVGYTQNVNLDGVIATFDSSVTTTSRIFQMNSSTINMDIRNSYLESRQSNVFRSYTNVHLWGDINFYNTYMVTGGVSNARLMECGAFATPDQMIANGATIGEVGSGSDLEVEFVEGTTYKVVNNNLATWNFYNCNFYNNGGDATIAALAYNMHYWGGYYFNANGANQMVTNTYKSGALRDVTGRVYFHTYTDEAGVVHYPAFNQDPSKGTQLSLPDFTDFDTTYTFDGTTYTGFKADNKTPNTDGGKIVANANEEATYGYVFVPNPSGVSAPIVEGATTDYFVVGDNIGSLSNVAAHSCPFPWAEINPWLSGKTLTKIGVPVKTVSALDENQIFTITVFNYVDKTVGTSYALTLPLDQLGDSTTVNKWVYIDLTPYNITLGENESIAFGKTGDTIVWGYGKVESDLFTFFNCRGDLTSPDYNTGDFTPSVTGQKNSIIFDVYYEVPTADAKISVADPVLGEYVVATVNGEFFDDFGLAAAAANGATVTLIDKVTSESTAVTAPVVVNTNGYEFNPNYDTEKLIIKNIGGNIVALDWISEDAAFVAHYYWASEEAAAAAAESFDWDTFDWEAGVKPEGLVSYRNVPAEASVDVTTVSFAGTDLSYGEDGNFFVHTKWVSISGSAEEGLFDYVPEFFNAGKATFLVIDDVTGAVLSTGYTDDGKGENPVYGDAFVNAMTSASSNTTIKLIADVMISSDNNALGSAPFTLDLNGHTLYLYDGFCRGKTHTPQSTCASGGTNYVGHASTFRTAGQLKLTVKSSAPGGVIFNGAREGNQFIWVTSSCTGGYVTFEGENLTVYASTIISTTVKGNSAKNPFVVTMNGGKYYNTNTCTSRSMLTFNDEGGCLEFYAKDAFFDCSAHQFLHFDCNAATADTAKNVTFENCVIKVGKDTDHWEFVGCRNKHVIDGETQSYYNRDLTFVTINLKNTSVLSSPINDIQGMNYSSPAINIYEGCFFAYEIAASNVYLKDGAKLTKIAPFNQTYVSTFGFCERKGDKQYSPETHGADFLASVTHDVNAAYVYTTSSSIASANLTLGGNVIETQNVYVPAGGAEQTFSYSVLENYVRSNYTATASFAAAGETKDVALELASQAVEVSGIKYNLTLASEIAINVAVPADVLNYLSVVVDGKTFTKDDATLVTIGEAEYYVITYTGITAINTVGTVEFAIVGAEGVTAKNIVTSVASYANTLMKKGATDVEKELGRALLVYTLEAYKALDAENTAAIEALTAYGAASVDDETFLPDDTSALAAYFTGAFLRLESTPGMVFVANEAAYGKTFTFTYVNEKLELVNEEVTFSAENTEFELEMKVYNLGQDITVTVEGADTVLSYNLDTYLASLAETNNAFAQAIYRYVAAAKAYVAPVVAE